MLRKVLPRTSFEQQLPEGWCLSRLYRGNRILYYRNTRVASISDDFDIENSVKAIISNPPECVQGDLYESGKISAKDLSSNIQKKLVKKGIIPLEVALNCIKGIDSWIHKYVPAVAEYNGETYTNKHNRWYNSQGTCINDSVMFLSRWDARVRYAKGDCTLTDVARYSWSAVLECLGDDHQRFINNVLQPKLAINRKGWAWEAKYKKKAALDMNTRWVGTVWDKSEEIEEEYREDVNSCLYYYFHESVEHQEQMFTEECNLPAFKDIKSLITQYEKNILEELGNIAPRLSKFRWNSMLKAYEPVFAPKPMSVDKRVDFYDLVHNVIVGHMSGHQAALMFSNGDWGKISRESDRYEKHHTQHVPFYTDRWKKLSVKEVSFSEAVDYVISNVRDLIDMGYRDVDNMIAAFNYDDCRFSVNIDTGEVKYLGVAGGNYMSDKWLKLKPEQRRKRLADDVEWEYQEKAIKSYHRLFSYLFNVVHKHWNNAECYLRDKLTARKKYLRPSSGFLAKMKEKADNYIKSLERGVVVC